MSRSPSGVSRSRSRQRRLLRLTEAKPATVSAIVTATRPSSISTPWTMSSSVTGRFSSGVDDAAERAHDIVADRHVASVPTRVGPMDELDALIAAPDNHLLMFENEHVSVLDTHIAPGETTPVHTIAGPRRCTSCPERTSSAVTAGERADGPRGGEAVRVRARPGRAVRAAYPRERRPDLDPRHRRRAQAAPSAAATRATAAGEAAATIRERPTRSSGASSNGPPSTSRRPGHARARAAAPRRCPRAGRLERADRIHAAGGEMAERQRQRAHQPQPPGDAVELGRDLGDQRRPRRLARRGSRSPRPGRRPSSATPSAGAAAARWQSTPRRCRSRGQSRRRRRP